MLNTKGYIFLVRTVTLTFPVHELSALDWSEKWFLTCSSFTIWSIWMKLHRYVDHQRLHIVGKDRHSYLSRLLSYTPLIDLRIGFWPVVHFIRPCSLFPIDNLSIYAQIFFKICIHMLLGMRGMGLLMGKIRPFSMELLPFLPLKNGFWPVILLLLMISEWNFTDMFHIKGYILQRRTVTLTFPVHELSALD